MMVVRAPGWLDLGGERKREGRGKVVEREGEVGWGISDGVN